MSISSSLLSRPARLTAQLVHPTPHLPLTAHLAHASPYHPIIFSSPPRRHSKSLGPAKPREAPLKDEGNRRELMKDVDEPTPPPLKLITKKGSRDNLLIHTPRPKPPPGITNPIIKPHPVRLLSLINSLQIFQFPGIHVQLRKPIFRCYHYDIIRVFGAGDVGCDSVAKRTEWNAGCQLFSSYRDVG
jgi:hypothetical protein